MPSITEREFLYPDRGERGSGFTPRSLETLALRKRPHTRLDIECQHFLRQDPKDSFFHQPSLQFQLWLDAGKHKPPFPDHPDPNYNSNVWRNFRRHYGFKNTADGSAVSEVIAAMYPLSIPPMSEVGNHTFDKYIQETNLFKDPRKKALAVKQTREDVDEFHRLRLKTEARNPPLDQSGKILPPENYKQYAHRFIPVPSPPPTPPPPGQKTDMFGQRYTPRSKPNLSKLTYKLNHPEYKRLQEEIAKQRKAAEERRKLKRSRALPSPVSIEGFPA